MLGRKFRVYFLVGHKVDEGKGRKALLQHSVDASHINAVCTVRHTAVLPGAWATTAVNDGSSVSSHIYLQC